MLKTMRSNVKALSWTLWMVILAFVGFIFVQWGTGELGPKGASNTLVWVGRSTISGTEFQKQLLRMLETYQRQMQGSFNRNLISQLRIPERILQSMIYAMVIENEAKKWHLSVSNVELGQAIRSSPDFQRDGKFIGVNEYQQLLAYQRIRVEEYEGNIRQELLAEKLKNFMASTLIIDEATLKSEYRKENDKVELDYISFKPEQVVKAEIKPTEAEIQEYFDGHRNDYKTQEKRSGTVVVIKFDDLKKEVKITEKELSEYYKENRDSFKIPGKTKVSRILAKYTQASRGDILKKMEDLGKALGKDNFAEQAKAFSEDEKAKEGGDWGYWDWQGFTSQEKGMIDRLDEGAVSTVVDTGEAFSILLISEKVPEKQETYSEVKSRIQTSLEREKCREIGLRRINDVYRKVKEASALKDSAKKASIPFVATGPLTNGESIKDVDPIGYISQKLFTMKKGVISEPFETPTGMVVAQLDEVQAPQLQKLAEVKESVTGALALEKKLDLAMAKAQDMAITLAVQKEQAKIDALLKAENLKAESTTYNRGNRLAGLPAQKDLDSLIFSLPDGVYAPPVRFKTEVVIVKPKTKTITTDADFVKNRTEFLTRRLEQEQNELYSSFLWKKRGDYQVRYNGELYDKILKSVLARIK